MYACRMKSSAVSSKFATKVTRNSTDSPGTSGGMGGGGGAEGGDGRYGGSGTTLRMGVTNESVGSGVDRTAERN